MGVLAGHSPGQKAYLARGIFLFTALCSCSGVGNARVTWPSLGLRLRGGGFRGKGDDMEEIKGVPGKQEELQDMSEFDSPYYKKKLRGNPSTSSSGEEEVAHPWDDGEMMRRYQEAKDKKAAGNESSSDDSEWTDVGKMAATFKWPGKATHLGKGRWKLATTRMEASDQGAEYGLFVDIQAKDKPILLTGLKTASHGISNKGLAFQSKEKDSYFQDPLEGLSIPFGVSVYTCDGSSRGKEFERSLWMLIAHNDSIQLPRINGKEDWDAEYRERWVGQNLLDGDWLEGIPAEPVYGHLPHFKPIRLEPGERRGFLIHCTLDVGIANRWPIHYIPALGDVADEDDNIALYSSRAMPESEAFTEEVDEVPFKQCKEGIASGLVEELEPDWVRRRREGHCFVGEVLYTVIDDTIEGDAALDGKAKGNEVLEK